LYSPDDTIVAIATPAGRGGIGVVRVSGPGAAGIAAAISDRREPLEARRATLTRIVTSGTAVDRAVLTFFPAPHSYTGEDVLEISAHGSPVLLHEIVAACMRAGARLAEPGEFTFRAYLRGRIDLVQAEAVKDLVDAVTPLQARAAFDQLEGTLTTRISAIDAALFDVSARLEASLDFPDEGYHFVEPGRAAAEIEEIAQSIDELLADAGRGRLVRDGAQIAIVGRPNAGKSSLFNCLAGAGRAIVTDLPGTTRDIVTEVIDLNGIALTLLDTAGLRSEAADAVEVEGMARAHAARRVADLSLVVLDRSRALSRDDEDLLSVTEGAVRVVVGNKSDLPAAWGLDDVPSAVVCVSAVTGHGTEQLRAAMIDALGGRERLRDTPAVTNMRHTELLSTARASLRRAAAATAAGVPEELVAADVTDARGSLEEVTGARTPDDVLHAIFDRFCIGK
jgi:tRNA modification GTPase